MTHVAISVAFCVCFDNVNSYLDGLKIEIRIQLEGQGLKLKH